MKVGKEKPGANFLPEGQKRKRSPWYITSEFLGEGLCLCFAGCCTHL